MSVIAAALRHMLAAGMPHDAILQAVEDMERGLQVDEQAGRRRASDRERKRLARLRKSAESAESADTAPPPKESSPTPPKEITPSRSEAIASSTNPRDELARVLDRTRTMAVIEHRQRIRKPLTAHAAKLLAGKFAKCPDPNAAADAMIGNGWQGFEVDWMDNRQRAGPAPPQKPLSLAGAFGLMAQAERERRDQDHLRTDEPAVLYLPATGAGGRN